MKIFIKTDISVACLHSFVMGPGGYVNFYKYDVFQHHVLKIRFWIRCVQSFHVSCQSVTVIVKWKFCDSVVKLMEDNLRNSVNCRQFRH